MATVDPFYPILYCISCLTMFRTLYQLLQLICSIIDVVIAGHYPNFNESNVQKLFANINLTITC